jgi:group I intron endonuclease
MNKWKRFQRKIKLNGKTYNSVYEACNKLKFSYKLALSRLAKGESVKNAFFKGKLLAKGIEVVIDNKKYRSLEDARLQLNPKASKRSVNWRYRNGWPIKAALELVNYQRKDREQIKFRGKTYESLSALARAYGSSIDLFIRRIKSPEYKHKFTISEALGLKKIKAKGFTKEILIKGKKFKSMTAAAKYYKYAPKTFIDKISKGWSPEQAAGLKKRKGHHPGKIGIIYIVRNKVNKKIYIGATLGSLANRWKWHVEKSKLKNTRKGSIGEAINEYGKNNFTTRILKRSKYISELSKYERYFIRKYNSMKPVGYNLSTGGIGYGNLGQRVEIKGKKFKTIKAAAKYYGVNPGTFSTRLSSGRTLEQAAGVEKYDKVPKNHIKVKINGKKFDNVRAAAKFFGLHDHTVRTRIGRGWSIERALKTKEIDLSKKIKFRGKTFGSIRKLAKYYKVSSGTLAGKISRGIPIKKALNIK